MIDTALSALEVATVESGRRSADALAAVANVAQRLEATGFRRVWYAEHHSSPLMADFPPAVTVAHVAASTSTIRVGSGGVLPPNHAPLSLAEQFGTLASLHHGRMDMGMGRGPGSFDQNAIKALRRGLAPPSDEQYRSDVVDVLQHLTDREDLPEPWLLASSTNGAGLAADLGLPMAFAYHLRPDSALESVERYRAAFKPSRWCESPRVMLSVHTVCADTDEDAARLARPMDIVQIALRLGGAEQPLPRPDDAAAHVFTDEEADVLGRLRAHQALGSPASVGRSLAETAERMSADELMLATPVYDAGERARSYELAMRAVASR
jgi:luciferase family oxidoreductase group 1